MKKLIPFLLCMLIALWACEKDNVNSSASVESMKFEGVPSKVDEGTDINLSQYLIIAPAAVGDTVTVNWTSSDEDLAIVSAGGSVEFLRNGNVTITAKAMGKSARAEFTVEKLGEMDTEMIREFFYAVSYSAMMNIHLKIMDGDNNHHMAEALFKSFGKALDMATMDEPRMKEAWTTKGSL